MIRAALRSGPPPTHKLEALGTSSLRVSGRGSLAQVHAEVGGSAFSELMSEYVPEPEAYCRASRSSQGGEPCRSMHFA